MSRTMFQTIRTLSIGLGLLTVGLIAALPETPSMGLSPAAQASAGPGGASVHPHAHRHARTRDAVAVPFFSFAQALRRGDRS